jgi:hypothetical protein
MRIRRRMGCRLAKWADRKESGYAQQASQKASLSSAGVVLLARRRQGLLDEQAP